MKSFFALLLTAFSFTSCTKTAISHENSKPAASIFYKDANVEVTYMNVIQSGPESVEINFSTLYEKDIQKIELMSGVDASKFCSIYVIDVTNNSESLKNYHIEDHNIKGNTMYYMFRFTYSNGDWSYSNYTLINLQ